MRPEAEQLRVAIDKARKQKHTLRSRTIVENLSLEEAYAIQAIRSQDRPIKGYKLGLLSPAKQKQMNIDQPIYGRIFPEMVMESPISLSSFIQPRVEPEIALILQSDVPEDASPGEAARAIGGFFLGVDILDSVWEGYTFTIAEVVADNTSGGGFILGEHLLPAFPTGHLRLFLNDRLLAEGPVEVLGNPEERLQWLARNVGGLRQGQVVFLGSPAAAHPAQPGTLRVECNHFSLIARLTS